MASAADSGVVDHTLCQQIERCVDELTTSGDNTLDEAKFKKVKNICKRSDGYVTHTFHVLMSQLQKPHAEIRGATCLIIDELFCRSHRFRELLLQHFQSFIELTLETNTAMPLPPPREVARKLKVTVQSMIQMWHQKYGTAYRKLTLGYEFLQTCKNVSFDSDGAMSIAERQRGRERESHKAAMQKGRIEVVLTEMKDVCVEIGRCLREVDSCLRLLLPTPEEFHPTLGLSPPTPPAGSSPDRAPSLCGEEDSAVFSLPSTSSGSDDTAALGVGASLDRRSSEGTSGEDDDDDDDTDDEDEDLLRRHGLASRTYTIDVRLDSTDIHLQETADNTDVLRALWDLMRLVHRKFQPAIAKWLEVLTKNAADGLYIKRVLDVRQTLVTVTEKVDRLKVTHMNGTKATSDSDSDSDFEEVPMKEGYESDVPEDPGWARERKEGRAGGRTSAEWQLGGVAEGAGGDEDDPASAASTLKRLQEKKVATLGNNPQLPSTGPEMTTSKAALSASTELHQRAPVVPYSTDLMNWGQKVETPMRVRFDLDHRFWNTCQTEDMVDKNALDAMRSRRITFAGRFEPVKWQCRAPLQDGGKLCERMDRIKCPFHGRIIARGKDGVPSSAADRQGKETEGAGKTGRKVQQEEWNDPELLRDIEAATGVKVTRQGRGKGKGRSKGKKKEYPNLTDLSKRTNTSRNRLEAKIFKRRTLSRVASILNSIDSKRFKDKFGNSFNYAYST